MKNKFKLNENFEIKRKKLKTNEIGWSYCIKKKKKQIESFLSLTLISWEKERKRKGRIACNFQHSMYGVLNARKIAFVFVQIEKCTGLWIMKSKPFWFDIMLNILISIGFFYPSNRFDSRIQIELFLYADTSTCIGNFNCWRVLIFCFIFDNFIDVQ